MKNIKENKRVGNILLIVALLACFCLLLVSCTRNGAVPGSDTIVEEPKPEEPPVIEIPEDVEVPEAHVHSWSDWNIVKEATCETDGSKERTCECGAKETQILNSLGHKWSNWKVTTKATCTTNGSEERTCSVCHKVETRATSVDHKWSKWHTTVKATCTTSGTEERTCNTCGKVETRTINALGHKWSNWKVTTKETCESDGAEERKCSACGKVETRTIQGGHKWSNWSVTKAATCTENGSEERTCSACHKNETRVINALGHKWSNWADVTKATCTSDGSQKRTCSTCGEVENQTINAYGHDYEWVITKEATEAEEGSKEYKCKRCGHVEKTETIPKIVKNYRTSWGTRPYEFQEVGHLLIGHCTNMVLHWDRYSNVWWDHTNGATSGWGHYIFKSYFLPLSNPMYYGYGRWSNLNNAWSEKDGNLTSNTWLYGGYWAPNTWGSWDSGTIIANPLNYDQVQYNLAGSADVYYNMILSGASEDQLAMARQEYGISDSLAEQIKNNPAGITIPTTNGRYAG